MTIKKYTLRVEADGANPGKYQVTIYGDDRFLGVPLRNATKKFAEESIPAIESAFSYGWQACDTTARDFMRTAWLSISRIPEEK
jgi:hypothetical protein